jgi:hypothetical protein
LSRFWAILGRVWIAASGVFYSLKLVAEATLNEARPAASGIATAAGGLLQNRNLSKSKPSGWTAPNINVCTHKKDPPIRRFFASFFG